MKTKLLIGITISLFLVSCATIMKGTEQTITINSNVDGADIYVESVKIGETPFVGKIKKNQDAIRIEEEGYKPYTLALSKSLEPIFWGNIIIGGTLGSITDFASGAAYTYSPSSYQVEMFREGESEAAFIDRFELRKYAMLNITDIAVDLGNKEGDYLETLIRLAKLPYNDESVEAVKSKFDASKGNEIVFGNKIVDLIDA